MCPNSKIESSIESITTICKTFWSYTCTYDAHECSTYVGEPAGLKLRKNGCQLQNPPTSSLKPRRLRYCRLSYRRILFVRTKQQSNKAKVSSMNPRKTLRLASLFAATNAVPFLTATKHFCDAAQWPNTTRAGHRQHATTLTDMFQFERGGAMILKNIKTIRQNKRRLRLLSRHVMKPEIGGQHALHSLRQNPSGDMLLTKKNIGWAISFGLSIVYLFLFVFHNQHNAYSARGFCVTNFDATAKTCPSNQNSHNWAWKEDSVFTFLIFLLPCFIKETNGGTPKLIASAASIFFHGVLHKMLSESKCHGTSVVGGAGMYTFFISFIAFFTLNDFGKFPLHSNMWMTVIVTFLTVALTIYSKQGIAAIFLTTQLLVSATALFFPKKGALTTLTGNTFTLPCLVSIIEFTCCHDKSETPTWFNKIGGHFWYDFFLHISVVASLIPENGPDI